MNPYPGGIISSFGAAPKETKGSQYLMETWKLGTITLYNNNVIENYPVNIDLLSNQLEINTDQGIKSIPLRSVKELKLSNPPYGTQSFVNTKELNGSNVQLTGIVELISSSNIGCAKYYSLVLKEGNYNAALDMGDDEKRFVIKSRYFFVQSQELIEVSKSRSKFVELFPENYRMELKTYLKDNKLSLKDENDIIVIGKYLSEKGIQFIVPLN